MEGGWEGVGPAVAGAGGVGGTRLVTVDSRGRGGVCIGFKVAMQLWHVSLSALVEQTQEAQASEECLHPALCC